VNLDLQDRSVLVTGGSGGIGRAIVLAYAAEGARVTLTYNSNEEAAAAIVVEVTATGGTATAVPMDLLDGASIELAMEMAIERHGG
jgi:NAD(P)-dependent dehydrogenase (short-subunit alcohol dehydrogenase family)